MMILFMIWFIAGIINIASSAYLYYPHYTLIPYGRRVWLFIWWFIAGLYGDFVVIYCILDNGVDNKVYRSYIKMCQWLGNYFDENG